MERHFRNSECQLCLVNGPAKGKDSARGTELRTGDIIGSGTVGTGRILELSRSHGPEAYPWLQPGDVVVLDIEHLGSIRAKITASD